MRAFSCLLLPVAMIHGVLMHSKGIDMCLLAHVLTMSAMMACSAWTAWLS